MTTLMIQGTTSDAGKSAVVTGLCRVLARRGLRVAPFKPQNMAPNSAVAADGGAIGRAQAAQAAAAGVEPVTDMNPVLLKPTGDRDAQVIVDGRAVADLDARGYHAYKRIARAAVLAAHARLAAAYDIVLVEGAGSPAEINLRAHDIANMGFAEAVDCPVLLVGDIDRGGVFAQFVGTLELLAASERERTRGFIVNRFRGDASLLEPGLDMLTARTGKPTLGVLPYLEGLHLDAEDALPCAPAAAADGESEVLRVIVPAIPRISNHTDFDPLRLHPRVDFRFVGPHVGPGAPMPPADLIILPGSNNTRSDLEWLRARGWTEALQRHLRYGGRVMGICGGLQMLGRTLHDPEGNEGGGVEGGGIEGEAGSTDGFGLLDLEMALGGATAALGADGVRSDDDRVLGTCRHGIFDQAPARDALLRWAGLADPGEAPDHDALREAGIDRLADACERALDLGALAEIIGAPARGLAADAAGRR